MLSRLTVAFCAALAAMALASPAVSAPLNGTFQLNIYNFDAGGTRSNTYADANNLVGRTLTDTLTYTGDLDFRINTKGGPEGGTPSILQFLNTGGGSLVGADAILSTTDLSSGGGSGDPNWGTTTLFEFIAQDPSSFSGNIVHDDGVSLYDDGILRTAVNAREPTTEKTTSFFFDGGQLRLIYAAANGDPSILEVSGGPAVIPVPPAGLLLIAGFGGLTLVSRRRKRAA